MRQPYYPDDHFPERLHGPFLVDDLSTEDYEPVPPSELLSRLRGHLRDEDQWTLGQKELDEAEALLSSVIRGDERCYHLRLTHRDHDRHRDGAGILVPFYEYVSADSDAGVVRQFILAED